jgi:hypothetical protein
MRFFGWVRRQSQQQEAHFSSPRRQTWPAGRRVLINTPYIIPKDQELPQAGINLPVRFVVGQKR